MSAAQRWTLAAIVLLAAALRLGFNDVKNYSPADESVYAGFTRTLLDRGFVTGYPEIVRAFVDEPARWRFPTPARWGYFALTTIAANITDDASPRTLAWLSTLAGIAVVPMIFLLARRLFTTRVALLAAAFTAVSSLELALGRRALQDEVFCFAVTVAIYFFIRALDETQMTIPAIASLTFAFAMKETFVLMMPAFIGLALVYTRPRLRHAALIVVPPALFALGFMLLSRSAGALFRIAQILGRTVDATYVTQYQAGPPHRVLFDFFVLAPFVSLLAAAAVVFVFLQRDADRGARAIALFLVIALATFGIVASKNLRFYVMLDPVIRLLAAWVVGRAAVPALVAIAVANGCIELELFATVFIAHETYDPVTAELLASVSALPRSDTSLDHRMLFPWLCAATGAGAWIWSKWRHARDFLYASR